MTKLSLTIKTDEFRSDSRIWILIRVRQCRGDRLIKTAKILLLLIFSHDNLGFHGQILVFILETGFFSGNLVLGNFAEKHILK